MKTHKERRHHIMTLMAALLFLLEGALTASAQNSLPALSSGGGWYGPGWNDWGNPWYNGWNYSPTIVVRPSVTNALSNQGVTKVVSCGYDSQGIWRVVPLTVSYQYDGDQYIVYVLNAWNPWTAKWDRGVDVQAYNTDVYMRGVEYSYYTLLPTGTFYFNL